MYQRFIRTWCKGVHYVQQVLRVLFLLSFPGGAGQLVRHPLHKQSTAVVARLVLWTFSQAAEDNELEIVCVSCTRPSTQAGLLRCASSWQLLYAQYAGIACRLRADGLQRALRLLWWPALFCKGR
jgi:hypothetical protein